MIGALVTAIALQQACDMEKTQTVDYCAICEGMVERGKACKVRAEHKLTPATFCYKAWGICKKGHLAERGTRCPSCDGELERKSEWKRVQYRCPCGGKPGTDPNTAEHTQACKEKKPLPYCTGTTFPHDGTWPPRSEVERKVIEAVAKITGKERIRKDQSFAELGMDELDVVELIMQIEDTFQIVVADEDANAITTVASLIEYVEKKRK